MTFAATGWALANACDEMIFGPLNAPSGGAGHPLSQGQACDLATQNAFSRLRMRNMVSRRAPLSGGLASLFSPLRSPDHE
jgi:hypothetical protein